MEILVIEIGSICQFRVCFGGES